MWNLFSIGSLISFSMLCLPGETWKKPWKIEETYKHSGFRPLRIHQRRDRKVVLVDIKANQLELKLNLNDKRGKSINMVWKFANFVLLHIWDRNHFSWYFFKVLSCHFITIGQNGSPLIKSCCYISSLAVRHQKVNKELYCRQNMLTFQF